MNSDQTNYEEESEFKKNLEILQMKSQKSITPKVFGIPLPKKWKMKYQGLLTILFVFLFTIGLLNLCTSINLYLYRKSSDSAEESSIVKKYQKLATKQLEVLKYKMIQSITQVQNTFMSFQKQVISIQKLNNLKNDNKIKFKIETFRGSSVCTQVIAQQVDQEFNNTIKINNALAMKLPMLFQQLQSKIQYILNEQLLVEYPCQTETIQKQEVSRISQFNQTSYIQNQSYFAIQQNSESDQLVLIMNLVNDNREMIGTIATDMLIKFNFPKNYLDHFIVNKEGLILFIYNQELTGFNNEDWIQLQHFIKNEEYETNCQKSILSGICRQNLLQTRDYEISIEKFNILGYEFILIVFLDQEVIQQEINEQYQHFNIVLYKEIQKMNLTLMGAIFALFIIAILLILKVLYPLEQLISSTNQEIKPNSHNKTIQKKQDVYQIKANGTLQDLIEGYIKMVSITEQQAHKNNVCKQIEQVQFPIRNQYFDKHINWHLTQSQLKNLKNVVNDFEGQISLQQYLQKNYLMNYGRHQLNSLENLRDKEIDKLNKIKLKIEQKQNLNEVEIISFIQNVFKKLKNE